VGNCTYCGQSAGFLRSKHKDCYAKNQDGLNQVNHLIADGIFDKNLLSTLDEKLCNIKTDYYLSPEQVKNSLVKNWENAVNKSLDDGLLKKEEEALLIRFKEHFNFSQEELNKNDCFFRLAKAAILRDITEGTIPERVIVTDGLPFNLLKNEKLVWLFKGTQLYEDRTKRYYTGGSSGLSIRIAKGLYYRTSAFRGSPVTYTQKTHIDTGILGVTNKHIYFSGATKNFRIKFEKIVAFIPYDDGIGIQKDGANAKPQTFVTKDGWFTYNLLSNLSQF